MSIVFWAGLAAALPFFILMLIRLYIEGKDK